MLTDLEPWFIEAARPRRLLLIEGALLAFSAPTEKRQIGPTEPYTGDVGDPWIPLNTDGDTALTVSKTGFTPELIRRLLFSRNIRRTFLQEPRPSDGTAFFVGSVLVGGNCKTDGFHRFVLPVPPKARMALRHKESRETLGGLAKELLTNAEKIERALSAALVVLSEGGPEKPDFDRDAVKRWIDGIRARFAKMWEAGYFPTLWRGVEESHETVRHDWQQELVNRAAALLDEASQRLPIPANRTWRALTRANNVFREMLRKHSFPFPGAEHDFTSDLEETTA
jgi:CRISPR system Cascade subunit CasA